MRCKVEKRVLPSTYINQIPSVYRLYVERTEDVKADGHCGFRAIAGIMFGNEDSWSRVRCDILNELSKNPDLWSRCFMERDRINVVEKTVSCFTDYAPVGNWFVLPDLGHMIATIYNVIFVALGGRFPATFLPLRSQVPSEPKCICISLVKMGRSKCLNHFIRVCIP